MVLNNTIASCYIVVGSFKSLLTFIGMLSAIVLFIIASC